eukprot:scaffold22663_cov111-Cylindrotheca_fusiformis.AAC.3
MKGTILVCAFLTLLLGSIQARSLKSTKAPKIGVDKEKKSKKTKPPSERIEAPSVLSAKSSKKNPFTDYSKSSKKNPSSPTDSDQQGLAVSGETLDLQVLSCDASSVTLDGSLTGNLEVGSFLLYSSGSFGPCGMCSPLFRAIESISDGSGTTKVLTTRFVSFGEVFGPDVGLDVYSELIEPSIGCSHTSDRRELESLVQHRNLQSFPRTCEEWRQINGDGQCTYTNCIVGVDGNPNDCFSCSPDPNAEDRCDNGCGAAGSKLNWDGNALLFSFKEACCIHDYCYSSTFSKASCDSEFYADMRSQCTTLSSLVLGFPLRFLPNVGCYALATAFYGLVAAFGDAAEADAVAKQEDHEQSDVCIDTCPSTTTSGGQGVTVLRIDMERNEGTFPISYEMFQIPDQLYIVYEGTRIFDTGDLVSGSQSSQVSFSGTDTVIEVTMFAPNSGTAWDLFVGCPV